MSRTIGIDFGTTHSVVSVWDPEKKAPVIIPNLRGETMTPSVVGLSGSGQVVVGEDARQNAMAHPADTVWEIKREMGRDLKVTLGGRTYSPRMITAFILRYLKICAERYLGDPVHDAVITVPAYFHEVQRGALRDAAAIAGLNVRRLVNEPTAAALAYASQAGLAAGARQIFAVYDLGGGGLDVSMIEITAEDITVLGTGGDPHLGGLDMDREMVNWALHEVETGQGLDLRGDEAVRRRLMLEAEGVRKRLAVSEATDLIVPGLTMIAGRPFDLELHVSRPQYAKLIRKLLDRSFVCLEEAVASSELMNAVGWKEIDGVLLAGGPTRLPFVRAALMDKLKAAFHEAGRPGKPFEIKAGLDPDEVAALGAAIAAAPLVAVGKPPDDAEGPIDRTRELAPEAGLPDIQISDVTGHSLGIAVRDDQGVLRFHRVIDKDTAIPVSQTAGPFRLIEDPSQDLVIGIYEGEQEAVQGNVKIGELRIADPEPRPGGPRLLGVTFTLDASGILSVICTESSLRTGEDRFRSPDSMRSPSIIKRYEGTFKLAGPGRMSKEDIASERRALTEVMAYGAPAAPDIREAPGAQPKIPLYLDEDVQFTVFRPRAVAPAIWHTLLAFAHLSERRPEAPASEPDPVAEVKKQARQVLGEKIGEYQERTQDSRQAVPREGELTFVPEVAGVEFNPPSRSFLWIEDVHREEFRFRASASSAGQTLRGGLSIYLGRILLADVPLAFRVDSAAAKATAPGQVSEGARPYRKIFASYSHRDLKIVEEFERYAAATGDRYLRDWIELRAGEVWNERLSQMIEEADIFQLFWSTASMTSPYVRHEWECALSLKRPPGFIRPVYWEEPFPESPDRTLPPDELRRLHFQRLSWPGPETRVGESRSAETGGSEPRFRTSDSLARFDEVLEQVGPDQIREEDILNEEPICRNIEPVPSLRPPVESLDKAEGPERPDPERQVLKLVNDTQAYMEAVKNDPPRTPDELERVSQRLRQFFFRAGALHHYASPESQKLLEGLTESVGRQIKAIGDAQEVLRLSSEFKAIVDRLPREPNRPPEALDELDRKLKAIRSKAEALPPESSAGLIQALDKLLVTIESSRLQGEFKAIVDRLQREPIRSPQALDELKRQLQAIKSKAELLPRESAGDLLQVLDSVLDRIEGPRFQASSPIRSSSPLSSAPRSSRPIPSVKASPGGMGNRIPWVPIVAGVIGLAIFLFLLILRRC